MYIKINKFRTDLIISEKLLYVRSQIVRKFFCDVFIKSLSDKQRKLFKNKPAEIFSSEILSSEIYSDFLKDILEEDWYDWSPVPHLDLHATATKMATVETSSSFEWDFRLSRTITINTFISFVKGNCCNRENQRLEMVVKRCPNCSQTVGIYQLVFTCL